MDISTLLIVSLGINLVLTIAFLQMRSNYMACYDQLCCTHGKFRKACDKIIELTPLDDMFVYHNTRFDNMLTMEEEYREASIRG